MRTLVAIPLTVLGLVAMSFVAIGAGAETPPREYETRLLHDHEDDWVLAPVQDGHDLIALDVREQWHAAAAQNVLVFRLLMSGGNATLGETDPTGTLGGANLTETVSFQVNDTAQEFVFETADNENFTGTFDAVIGPLPAENDAGEPDAEIFALEGVVAFETLNASVGDPVTDVVVQGRAGDAEADTMPGSPLDPVGGETAVDEDTNLSGPVQYAQANASDDSLAFTAGAGPAMFNLTVSSLLDAHNQTVTLAGSAPPGIEGGFLLEDGTPPDESIALEAGGARTVTVVLSADRAVNGTLALDVLTSLGGRVTVSVDLSVAAPPPPPTPTPTPFPNLPPVDPGGDATGPRDSGADDEAGNDTDDEAGAGEVSESPGPGAVFLMFGAAALAVGRRLGR